MFELGMAQPGFEVTEGVRFYAREVLQEWIANPGRDILTVADDGDGMLGFLICRPFVSSALLENLAVRAEHQHHGVAKALLDDCLRRLAELGIGHISAMVREANPALSFFERMGFRVGYRFHWVERTIPDLGPGA
ncbi:GNAT family N-acetyltransferase [Micromonospora sp. NPDC049374]|uniref:GNAT family N-acetyltransferase n=1 Tax=unclassified Micromonospora TaxID=2617518 RepID=UPI003421D70F